MRDIDETRATSGAADQIDPPTGVVVVHPTMKQVYRMAARLGSADIAVLVMGETGSGKEHVAEAIHQASRRARAEMITLNCAALNANLIESQLFGHTAGAFSGATRAQPGLVEAASGSTLFLDEVGELPLEAQAKLLRVLQAQQVRRLGAIEEHPVDIRVVAATNRDLTEEVEAGSFRADLYYRLAAASLWVPPLRARADDIVPLAEHFLTAFAREAGRAAPKLSDEARRLLRSYPWPGNVRELRNVIQYLVATVREDDVPEEAVLARLHHRTGVPPPVASPGEDERMPFRRLHDEVQELERLRIRQALRATDGNKTRAAELLGIPIRTMFEKVRQHELQERKPK